ALLFAAVSAPLLIEAVRGEAEQRRAHREGRPLRPGLKFSTDYAAVFGILGVIMTLGALALWAGRQEGLWKVVPLVLVNLVLQPIWLLLLVGAIHLLWHALHGRLTYALEVIPPGEMPADEYRKLVRHRAVYSLLTIPFLCDLIFICVW